MIEQQYLKVLGKICTRLKDHQIDWAVTGSLGMALQGMEIEVHDIDLQTDQQGSYALDNLFPEYVVKHVHYSISERIRSYLSVMEIDGIKVDSWVTFKKD